VTPDLTSYDVIVINSSAGKDSQAMLDYVAELARTAGVSARVVVVHCDLGRVEWKGTRELAEEQARHYGFRFEVVSRDRDLLHQIEFERKKFPDSARRYCTSDQKTSQVTKLITKLVAEQQHVGRQVRILNCLGLRGQESPARAKKPAFSVDKATNGKRHVDRWLAIHEWTVEQVWERIRAAGTRVHEAYALGMPRLSCVFCVFASKDALLIAGKHNPELLGAYVGVEERIGHDFKKGFKLRVIQDELAAGLAPAQAADWAA
jgi:3'-phosphoadenosine 5'-phosphosulfate sulfotransferase (PAPS reductase)/FAD synthetase